MRKAYLLVACCLLITSLGFSQAQQIRAKTKLIHGAPTTCPNDPVLVSDGTAVLDDIVFQSSAAYYALNAKAGHSYAIEVYDHIDNTDGVSPTIKVTSDCNTPIPGVVDVTKMDPDLSGGFSARVSWIQGSSDQMVFIAVMNPDPNFNYNYDLRATDTTLFNPRWSTYAPFDTQWGFANTTSTDISGTLTVFNASGAVVATISKTFPAGLFTLVSALGSSIPVKNLGDATFAYIGPPGGILADAYAVNNTATVIVPYKFEGRHAYH